MTSSTAKSGLAALLVTTVCAIHAHADPGSDPPPTNLQMASLSAEAEILAPSRNAVRAARIGKLPADAFSSRAGAILKQTGHVSMACFPGKLRGVLVDISQHFGRPVVVTSGYRGGGRRFSYHKRCMAADIQIAGVSPRQIARFARAHHAVGGVGTYGHTRSVHVDIGEREFTWHGSSRRRNAALGTGCCPACASLEAARTGRRFEAVCTG